MEDEEAPPEREEKQLRKRKTCVSILDHPSRGMYSALNHVKFFLCD